MNPFGMMIDALARADRSSPTETPLPDEGYPVTVHMLYRPTGVPLAMLRALELRGRATSGELADVGGVDAKQVGSILRPALRYGLARFVVHGHKRHWEWVGS